MDLNLIMYLIVFVVMSIVLILGWEIAGRWAYLRSRTVRRLHDVEGVAYVENLAGLQKDSLAYRLVEANLRFTATQFSLLAIGLGFTGAVLVWTFFIPGLPALMVGGVLFYIPFAYVKDRARGRGRKIDELLPIALSRIATGLQVSRGLDETLEEVAQSLLSEGPNPLSPELLKTAKDIRTKKADQALRDLASRSPSLSLSNVAMLLESYQRAGGGQYADVVSDTARAVQHIIAVRNHANAKASQPLQAARMVPAMLAIVLLVMMNDPMTRASFQHPLVQIVLALAIGVMVLGYLVMRNDVLKVV